jgi:hypothetical protein
MEGAVEEGALGKAGVQDLPDGWETASRAEVAPSSQIDGPPWAVTAQERTDSVGQMTLPLRPERILFSIIVLRKADWSGALPSYAACRQIIELLDIRLPIPGKRQE